MGTVVRLSSSLSEETQKSEPQLRRNFYLPISDWRDAVIFIVTVSLCGLHFYPAFLLLFVLLLRSFRYNRYDFAIQIMLVGGVYGLYRINDFPIKIQDIIFGVSFVVMIFYRYTPVMKRITIAMLVYFGFLIFMSILSEESMAVQIRNLRIYMMISFVFIPLALFSGRPFDMEYFMKKVLCYSILLSCCYIFDGFIYSGFFFLPGLKNFGPIDATIFHPVFDLFTFPRRYPQGIFILAMAIFPVVKYFRISIPQWIITGLAIISTRTMTFIAGLVVTFVICQGNFLKLVKYAIFTFTLIIGAYIADIYLDGNLRVVSTVNQFTILDEASDEEDAADFGSGRIAQFVPKYNVLVAQGKTLRGFGFLHDQATTNPRFIIENTLYQAGAKYEVVTGVEVTQLQTILDIGYIGLAVQTVFYLLTYLFVRKLRYSFYYLSVLIALSIFGIGGFAGLTQTHGLFIAGLTLAAVILANREDYETENQLSDNQIIVKA